MYSKEKNEYNRGWDINNSFLTIKVIHQEILCFLSWHGNTDAIQFESEVIMPRLNVQLFVKIILSLYASNKTIYMKTWS